MKAFNYSLLILFLTFALQIKAQIPDDTNGRLYRLGKTWGYLKHYSQHRCELKWDTLLHTTVESVLAAGSNEEFNAAMLTMLNKVGNNAYQESQFPYPDTNLNFDDSWIDDAVFSNEVRSFLDTFSVHIYPDTSGCLVSLNDGQTPGYISLSTFSTTLCR